MQAFQFWMRGKKNINSNGIAMHLGHECCAVTVGPFIAFWVPCTVPHFTRKCLEMARVVNVVRPYSMYKTYASRASCQFTFADPFINLLPRLKFQEEKLNWRVVRLRCCKKLNELNCRLCDAITYPIKMRYSAFSFSWKWTYKEYTIKKGQDSERFIVFSFLSHTNRVTKWH